MVDEVEEAGGTMASSVATPKSPLAPWFRSKALSHPEEGEDSFVPSEEDPPSLRGAIPR